MTQDACGRARGRGRFRRRHGRPSNHEGGRGWRYNRHSATPESSWTWRESTKALNGDSDSDEDQNSMTPAQSTPFTFPFNNTATSSSQTLFGSNSATMSPNHASQPQFGSFGGTISNNFAHLASQSVFGASPFGNTNPSSSLIVTPQPQLLNNSSANSPTFVFGQPQQLTAQPGQISSGRSDAQRPQISPENQENWKSTALTSSKRQAEDQASTSNLPQDTKPPNKLIKTESRDEPQAKDQAKGNSTSPQANPTATNAGTPDFVLISSSTVSRELRSFGDKIEELQKSFKHRYKTFLELNTSREQERAKLSARRALCLKELKEAYAKLDEIQAEEADLEKKYREMLGDIKEMEEAHENNVRMAG